MSADPFHVARARYGSSVRRHGTNSAAAVQARQAMQEEAFVAAVNKALAKAPPLSDKTRDRVVTLLMSAPPLDDQHPQR